MSGKVLGIETKNVTQREYQSVRINISL